VIADPTIDFLIGGAGGDEVLELGGVEAGELPEVSAEAAGEVIVFAVDAKDVGARFVEHASTDNKSAQGFAGAAWWSFAEIASEWF